ncbi:hypothetical protein GE21DRAFT_1343698 [Neurospora crassa]|nr:related to 50S RIBOSOMAL PROTEIN L2 [imported] - Neurospora crassa [Neurospora crassa]KHE87625.1 hypothetical protein GE21DRAFT_1343698 [Neurospora crassa]
MAAKRGSAVDDHQGRGLGSKFPRAVTAQLSTGNPIFSRASSFPSWQRQRERLCVIRDGQGKPEAQQVNKRRPHHVSGGATSWSSVRGMVCSWQNTGPGKGEKHQSEKEKEKKKSRTKISGQIIGDNGIILAWSSGLGFGTASRGCYGCGGELPWGQCLFFPVPRPQPLVTPWQTALVVYRL